MHRSELVDPKNASKPPRSLLRVKHGFSGRAKRDEKHGKNQRDKEENTSACSHDIEEPLAKPEIEAVHSSKAVISKVATRGTC